MVRQVSIGLVSMSCNLCGHQRSRVLRTVYDAGDIRRVRQCDGCGHKWVTLEVPVDTVSKAREVFEAVKAIAERVL